VKLMVFILLLSAQLAHAETISRTPAASPTPAPPSVEDVYPAIETEFVLASDVAVGLSERLDNF
jgi:hypothetical protein